MEKKEDKNFETLQEEEEQEEEEANSLPLPGKLVSLNGDTGNSFISTTETDSDTTDANGQATFTVNSNTIETETFTATSDMASVTQTVAVNFVTADAPAVLVYEGFNYDLGVLTGKNGGTGFGAGWASPEASFVASVYDETGSSLVSWDNVVGNVTMSSPPRYIASTVTATSGSTATRLLASDAGTLAGADNVLWMGVVFHYQNSQGSAALNIGLTSGGSVIDRGRQLNTSGMDFIGVTNWAQASTNWNNKLNATIIHDHVLGIGYGGPYVQTLGTQAPIFGSF